MTNCTFSENSAREGGGLYNQGDLLLNNTTLANSVNGGDCVAKQLDSNSTRNLIEENDGCGQPISSADPHLEPLGYFNGPTKTYPLGGGSPAINLGENAAAVDESDQPLVWDQRGNGDPRFVAGYTDIGAFEHKAFPALIVDTIEDTDLRACARAGMGDCPLRGAIDLANATPEPDVITFDTQVFEEAQTLLLIRPLPEVTAPLTLDASGTGRVKIMADGPFAALVVAEGVTLELHEIAVEKSDEPASKP